MLSVELEISSTASLIRTSSSIAGWYARRDDRLCRLWLLEDGAGLLLGRVLKLLARLVKLLAVCEKVESTTQLQMYPAPCVIICGISQVPLGVERFLDAKTVDTLLLTTTWVPALLFSRYPFALANGYRLFLVVYLVPV
jgi:hypothetical protein